ncbi:hypothetical protein QPK32_18250 [Massilia sp. YIM B02763]|uniref:hypothetical protein n=1 Tax=Massilia sp. YIM B02763 TaxID=3050130 RepID=UPI0025B62FA0|nr:hypothetical protein [Massilia sp. YIM B02763]MDN4055020.1 hypothetical protein [Massilia sp. YIM B02763]
MLFAAFVGRPVALAVVWSGCFDFLGVPRSSGAQVREYGSMANVPAEAVGNVRNDMYLVSGTMHRLDKDVGGCCSPDTRDTMKAFRLGADPGID